MFKAWFGAEVMNYVKSAIVPNRGIKVWVFIYVTRISLVLEHLLLQYVCLIHHTSVFVPFQFRWPWQTALLQTEPVRTPTPSLTAGRPMLTWLISEPSHGWCSQVRPDMKPMDTNAVALLHVDTMTSNKPCKVCLTNRRCVYFPETA